MPMQNEENIVIGFDLDGVIIDHTQNKIMIASRHGVTLAPHETHAEQMAEYFTPEMYRDVKAQLYNSTPEALAAPLMEGAFGTLATLREHNVPYFLVSLQKSPMHALHLLEERGLWGSYFTPENTFFAQDREEKHVIATSIGVSHFIDDEPNVLDIMTLIPNRILFDMRNLFPHKTDYHRVESWEELRKILGIAHL